jgi:D-alanyl-D-alanine carboxypeptidase
MRDFSKYYHYFSTQTFSYNGTTYRSHNRMVRNTAGVDGLKTGFIRASGFNVATSAKRGDRRVIAVVMGGQTAAARDQHMAQLLDRSFSQGRTIQLASNTSNARAVPVATLKTSVSTPVPKPSPVLEKLPASVVTQQIVQPAVNVQPQKVAMRESDGWAVQIGSYHEADRAHAQAQAAARWIPGEVMVTEVEISNRKLYRARLVGLHESQARSACQNLSRQGMGCLVVRS